MLDISCRSPLEIHQNDEHVQHALGGSYRVLRQHSSTSNHLITLQNTSANIYRTGPCKRFKENSVDTAWEICAVWLGRKAILQDVLGGMQWAINIITL
jgi:hypothetical protein